MMLNQIFVFLSFILKIILAFSKVIIYLSVKLFIIYYFTPVILCKVHKYSTEDHKS
jgi:hypothetical protein